MLFSRLAQFSATLTCVTGPLALWGDWLGAIAFGLLGSAGMHLAGQVRLQRLVGRGLWRRALSLLEGLPMDGGERFRAVFLAYQAQCRLGLRDIPGAKECLKGIRYEGLPQSSAVFARLVHCQFFLNQFDLGSARTLLDEMDGPPGLPTRHRAPVALYRAFLELLDDNPAGTLRGLDEAEKLRPATGRGIVKIVRAIAMAEQGLECETTVPRLALEALSESPLADGTRPAVVLNYLYLQYILGTRMGRYTPLLRTLGEYAPEFGESGLTTWLLLKTAAEVEMGAIDLARARLQEALNRRCRPSMRRRLERLGQQLVAGEASAARA